MNTLDDLRSVLATRAEAVSDTAAGARTASVVERVRAARRRRATNSLVAAVVVAVAAAGIAVPVARSHRSAPVPAGDIRVGGIDVPQGMTLDGFGYRYATNAEPVTVSMMAGAVKGHRVRVRVPANVRDQAILLVGSHLGGGTVTLRDANGSVEDRISGDGSTADRAGTPIPTYTAAQNYTLVAEDVPPGAVYRLVVYRRDDEMPAGVSDPGGDSVFRYRIGGRTLVAAAWAKPGRTSVPLHVPGDLSRDLIVAYCRSSNPHAIYGIGSGTGHVLFSSSGCAPVPDEDPGRDGDIVELGIHTVAQHRLVLTIGTSADRNTLKDMRPIPSSEVKALGFAVYRLGPTTDVLGENVEHTIDYDGRLWTLARIERSNGATRRQVYRDDSHAPEVLTVAVQGHGGFVTTRTTIPGVTMSDLGDGAGAAGITGGPYLPDGRYNVTVHAQHPIRSALAVYRPVPDHSEN